MRRAAGTSTGGAKRRASAPGQAFPRLSARGPRIAAILRSVALPDSRSGPGCTSGQGSCLSHHRRLRQNGNADPWADTRTPCGRRIGAPHPTRRDGPLDGQTDRAARTDGRFPCCEAGDRCSPPRDNDRAPRGRLQFLLGSAPTFAENRSGHTEGDPDTLRFAGLCHAVARRRARKPRLDGGGIDERDATDGVAIVLPMKIAHGCMCFCNGEDSRALRLVAGTEPLIAARRTRL